MVYYSMQNKQIDLLYQHGIYLIQFNIGYLLGYFFYFLYDFRSNFIL